MRAYLTLALVTLWGLGFGTGYNGAEALWARQCESPDREKHFQRSLDLFAGRDTASALALLKDFEACQEPRVEEELLKAQIALSNGDLEETEKFSSQAIALDPFTAEGYRLRGLAYRQERKLMQALHDLDRSLELEPDDAEVRETVESVEKELSSAS